MKKIVRDFILHSNTYLAFGASIVSYMTIMLLGFPFMWEPVIIPFTICFFIYNVNRYTDISEDKVNVPERVEYFRRYGRYLLYISIALYLSSLFISMMHNIWSFFYALLPVILGISYSVLKLKRFMLIKNFIVCISWSSTVLLAASFYSIIFSIQVFIFFIFFLLSAFINTCIFDIKDVLGDKINKIKTIPIKIGIKRTRYICFAVNTLAVIILAASSFLGIIPQMSILLVILSAYISAYIYMAGKEKTDLFYGIIVDGEFIFLFIAANIIISLMALI